MVELVNLALDRTLRRRRLHGLANPGWLTAASDWPVVAAVSTTIAVCGWIIWVVFAELARRTVTRMVAAFQLTLVHDPWLLWAPLPVSCLVALNLGLTLHACRLRAVISKRVLTGGAPFPSYGPGSDPRAYFTTAGWAAATAWLVHGALAALLCCTAVWLAAMKGLWEAQNVVKSYPQVAAQVAAPAASLADSSTASATSAVAVAAAAAESAGAAAAASAVRFPGGFCPPGCMDLSYFKYYFGDDSCTCNFIGGVFAAAPQAAEAMSRLTWAMVGLGLLWAGFSWLLMNVASQFSHTQSEALLLPPPRGGARDRAVAAAEAGRAGAPAEEVLTLSEAGERAVCEMSDWMVRKLPGGVGGSGPMGLGGVKHPSGPGGSSSEPLLGGRG